MSIGEICSRKVSCCEGDLSALQAAAKMRADHVGDLVVVTENQRGIRVPVGIITDRDLVVEVLAQKVDPETISVREFVTEGCLCISEQAGIGDAVTLMRESGVRRLPVTDERGALVGIVTADDLALALAREQIRLAEVGFGQRTREAESRA
jgi:CBS domain-containing protein